MKLQIFIPVTILTLFLLFSATSASATADNKKRTNTEQAGYKINEEANFQPGAGHSGYQNNSRPFKQHHKDNEKDHQGPKDATHRRSHSEEDGKHHHFHMHRARRAKKHAGLVCFLAKLFLLIAHICLLVYVYHSTLAHAAH